MCCYLGGSHAQTISHFAAFSGGLRLPTTETWLEQLKDGEVVKRRQAIRELAARPADGDRMFRPSSRARRRQRLCPPRCGFVLASSAPTRTRQCRYWSPRSGQNEQMLRTAAERSLKKINTTEALKAGVRCHPPRHRTWIPSGIAYKKCADRTEGAMPQIFSPAATRCPPEPPRRAASRAVCPWLCLIYTRSSYGTGAGVAREQSALQPRASRRRPRHRLPLLPHVGRAFVLRRHAADRDLHELPLADLGRQRHARAGPRQLPHRPVAALEARLQPARASSTSTTAFTSTRASAARPATAGSTRCRSPTRCRRC